MLKLTTGNCKALIGQLREELHSKAPVFAFLEPLQESFPASSAPVSLVTAHCCLKLVISKLKHLAVSWACLRLLFGLSDDPVGSSSPSPVSLWETISAWVFP